MGAGENAGLARIAAASPFGPEPTTMASALGRSGLTMATLKDKCAPRRCAEKTVGLKKWPDGASGGYFLNRNLRVTDFPRCVA
jgi:hypothetical protein